jgi:predicted ATP-grasp superfamily ATP-dependent carboligase
MNILITGARSYVAYEWGKALSKHHAVFFADSLLFPISRFSRFPSTYIRIASPNEPGGNFARDITFIVDRYSIDLILPTCEEVFHLSQFKHQLSCDVFCDDHERLLQLHDKQQILEWAGKVTDCPQVKLPKTHRVGAATDIQVNADSILKPVYSRFGAEVIMSVTDTIKAQWSDARPWIQQEKIIGRSWCNYAIAHHGKMLAHTAYQAGARINQSASLYLVAQPNTILENFTLRFIEQHGYHGQIAFDFIERNGQFYLIECNPRGTSGVHLLSEQGLVNALIDQQPITYRLGDRQFSWPIKLFGLLGKVEFNEMYHPHAEDILGKDDFFPKCLSLLSLAELAIIALRHHCTLTQASSYDIEWND